MDAAVVGLPVSSPQPTQLTFEDGLGERRYAIGASGEPIEVLRLSSALSSVSSFDFALRERAARLSAFRHESYARVRSIELDRRTLALVVTSDHVPGVRLSTFLAEAHRRGLSLDLNAVRCLIRQLVRASAVLHDAAPDVANTALAPERLVLTPSGRLVIVEYVLGAALEQLGYTRARYWREIGIALPGSGGAPAFDARADVTQVGLIALAAILGRRISIDEFPDRLDALVLGATTRSVMGDAEPVPVTVRTWLLRALQLDARESFATPAEARAALDEAFGRENAVAELGALQVFFARYAASEVPVDLDLGPQLEAMKAFLARYPSRRSAPTAPEKPEPVRVESVPVPTSRRLRIAAAAAGLVILTGAAVGGMLYLRAPAAMGSLSVTTLPSGIAVFVDGAPHGVTPLGVQLRPGQHLVELRTDTEQRRIPIALTAGAQVSQHYEFARAARPTGELLVGTEPMGAAGTVDGRTASLVVSLGAAQRSAAGSIRVEVPAEVQIYEGGRLIGGSALDRILLPVGRHDLEFVNEPLGYRERRAVQIAAGQTTAVRLEWPRGAMAINAIPWAEVFVDGERVGETPIGAIQVPIGTHEVLFRHPDLGERRLPVTVTTGEPLKVGVDLRSK